MSSVNKIVGAFAMGASYIPATMLTNLLGMNRVAHFVPWRVCDALNSSMRVTVGHTYSNPYACIQIMLLLTWAYSACWTAAFIFTDASFIFHYADWSLFYDFRVPQSATMFFLAQKHLFVQFLCSPAWYVVLLALLRYQACLYELISITLMSSIRTLPTKAVNSVVVRSV